VRKSTHSVMTTWVECNHPWGRVRVKQAWEKKEIQVGRREFLQLARSEEKPEFSVGKEWEP
jgi:hypothetical protein